MIKIHPYTMFTIYGWGQLGYEENTPQEIFKRITDRYFISNKKRILDSLTMVIKEVIR